MLNIKKIRKSKGITQKEASEKSGIPLRSWNAYENGNRTPGADIMPQMAQALGVSISQLYGESNDIVISEHSNTNPNKTDDKSEYFFQIIKENVDKLSEKDKKIIELEKEIEELKKKVNKKLKERGLDLLD